LNGAIVDLVKLHMYRENIIAALTREHGGWPSRLRGGRPTSAVGSSALFRRAERDGTWYLTKSAPRFRATQSRGTSYSIELYSSIIWMIYRKIYK